jgi:hypothetical protein
MLALERLELGSVGMTDASLPHLSTFLERHAHTGKLKCVTLGSYKSTKFFRLQANLFADADALVHVAESGALGYFGLHRCLASVAVANEVLDRSPKSCAVECITKAAVVGDDL